MLEVNGGLESILSFLKDETFFKNNLKSYMKTFGRDKERILRILIAILTSLSQVDDRQLRKLFIQKSQDLIVFMFEMIKNNTEITSDLAFSAYLFLFKCCNDDQCENGFDTIPTKIKDYLKKCVDDFNNNKNQKDLNKNNHTSLKRKERDLIIGKKSFEKLGFYVLDVDNCGIATTLNDILDSLASLASKNTKNINFKSLIYTELKPDLDIVLEKGSRGEKRLVLEIYKHLACDKEISKKLTLSEDIKNSILKCANYKEILENEYKNLIYFLGQNWETKDMYAHDNQKTTSTRRKQDFIFLGFNEANEEQCNELKKMLEDTLHYSVELHNIEDDEGTLRQWKRKCFVLFL
jgi:hypothetical protein